MKRILTTALIMISFSSHAMAQDAISKQCGAPAATSLAISSQSSVKAAPDMATVSAGVVTDALAADAALKENAIRMNAVFAALKKAGIKDNDIQTSGISISPQYNYVENKSPKIIGYQATNTVSIIMRDLKSIGKVLDALVSQGVNQLNGPEFSIDNSDRLMDQVRKDAIKKARQRAEIYAAATGMKIKRIASISEQVGYNNPVPFMRAKGMLLQSADAAVAAPSPVASGQVDVNVTVNIAYELEE